MKLHISPFTRIGLIFLLLSLHFIFFIMTISMFNFFFDHPKYNFDFINFTRASYNNLFNSCTYLNCKSSYTTTIFIDISFTFILFFQSIFFIHFIIVQNFPGILSNRNITVSHRHQNISIL